ncbi:MAG TPA: DNA double-strand break repair nuclease NurA [Thermoplasmata archaeon]|nr:DNA double-strand break repair nuclease NurA [Thermoplasmata archaeon]
MTFVDEMRQELAKALQAHVKVPIPDEEVPEFHPITPAADVREMVAVDGSYSFLLNMSSWWLALVSVGLLKFSFDGEAYHRHKHRLEQRIIAVSTWEEYVQTQDELHKALFEFTQKSAEQHRDMVNEFRRLIEGQLAINFAADEKNGIVAVDGALQEFPKRFEFMERLVKLCEDRGHILVGISKDSALHGFGNVLTDEDFLKRCEDRVGPGPAFVRAAQAVQSTQKGLLYGDVFYAKFHEKAPKWFRVDIGTFRKEPEYVFGQIAPYCRSLISIGYPLPLLEAHRMAVTVRQMRSAYLELLIRTATKMGMDIKQVLDGLTAMEGRRQTAFHEYLDRISRGLR